MSDRMCKHGEEGAYDDPGICSACCAELDADYDDSQDHTRCPDCDGSGEYVGLNFCDRCPTCEGAGWL